MEAIKVNLIPNGIPQTCHASQYDVGRQIRLDLFDGFTPYVIQSGDTFTLNVRKPDNHVITETVTGTEGNTYLVIETTEQMTAVMGKNLCEIRVENSGDNIGSLNFIMQVERDVIADGIPSESVIEDLGALVAEAVGDDFYTKSEVDDALETLAGEIPTKTSDLENDSDFAVIDDTSTANNKTWSAEKIDEEIVDTVEAQMSEVIGHGKNLINPDDLITSTGQMDVQTGAITLTGGTYAIYGYYDVENGSTYAISKSSSTLYVYQYNADGTYCGVGTIVTVGGGSQYKTFTAAGDKVVIVLFKTLAEQTPQLELGSSPTPYEAYHKALQSSVEVPIIGTETLNTTAQTVIPAVNEVNTNEQRDNLTFERSYNLIDPMAIVSGYLGSAGGITSSNSYFTTDFVACEEADVVRSSHSCYAICFYNSSKEFISGSRTTDTSTATAPANAAFVRASYLANPTKEQAALRCLYISATEKAYEPYYKIKSAYLPTVESPYPDVKMLMPRKLAIANNVNISVNLQSVIQNWNVNLSVQKGVAQQLFPIYDNKIVISGGSAYDSVTITHLADYNVPYNIHQLSLLNVPANAGSGLTKTALFIGDSKTDANIYTQMLLDMFDDDVMNLTLIGTRGNTPTNRHEGRSGWSAKVYCTNEWERGVVDDSPFYNPNTQEFDFDYYMTTNRYSHVDYVFICLGTNDSESNFIDYYKEMIDSIKDYDSDIIVGVWTPAPFATFGGYTNSLNNLQMMPKIEDVLNEFDNDTYEAQGVYVVPTHMNIDTFYDFPWTDETYNDVSNATYRRCTDNIHETYGYCHDADVIFGYIKYFATL